MPEYQRETISRIISRINGSILLPDIQRPFVWEEAQIYKLFDSLMRGYPISTFLFWRLSKEQLKEIEKKDKLEIKMYKFVDSNNKESEPEINRERDNYELVLDGQQRLTSIYIALKGTWQKKSFVSKELYFDVLSGQCENEDGILFDFQFFDSSSGLVNIEENSSSSLKVWVNVKRIYNSDIGQAEKKRRFVDEIINNNTRLLQQYSNDIYDKIADFNCVLKENNIINYFPEDETDYDKVLDIFVRTNAGGTKLGYSDLLFSKIKLKWTKAREEFKELLVSVNKNNFEFDTDFVLKSCLLMFSNNSEDVRYSISKINNDLVSNIKDNWDAIVKATGLTIGLLDTFLIKDKKLLPSYNALIPIVYWHYKKSRSAYRQDREMDANELLAIRVWLIKALLSGAFGGQSDTVLYKCKEAIDKSTANIFPSEEIQTNIKTMKNRSMDIGEEVFGKFLYGTKESHLFLALCYKLAINFQPIMKGNFPEQDHIFSKNELEQSGVSEDKINSIYNIRYVSMGDNREKSKTPYSEWVAYLGDNKHSVFKTHLIPNGDWSISNFDDFLAARKSEMIKQIQNRIAHE